LPRDPEPGERRRRARDSAAAALDVVGLAAIGLLVTELFVLDPVGRADLRRPGELLLVLAAIIQLVRAGVAIDRRAHLGRNRVQLALAVAIAVRAGALGADGRLPPWLAGDGGRLGLLGALAALAAWRAVGVLRRRLRATLARGRSSTHRPLNAMLISFPAAAVVGAALLMLPRSHAPGAPPMSFLDAFFTATSAVCVTGLTVRDTGADFSPLGQGVILALIQVGGLGIMTFAMFFSVVLGRASGLSERVAASEVMSGRPLGMAFRLLTFVVVVTVTVELVGALILVDAWPATAGAPFGERLRYSLFHSVSAFCNAGFALAPESLAELRGRPGPLAVMAVLIVAGGIGFGVLLELIVKSWRALSGPLRRAAPPVRLGLHARLVVRTSCALIVVGLAGILLLSRTGTGPGPIEATFLAISARTAGFSTGDLGRLSGATLLLLMGLMFVGASPGSTGGGVKTTTIGVVFAGVRAMWRQRDDVDLMRRTVPAATVRSAFVIVVVSAGLVFVTALVLMASQPHLAFRDVLFEVTSAYATVGLSTGVTGELDPFGRVVLCVAMYLGRLGPLSIMVLLVRGRRRLSYRYAEEGVEVG